MKKQKTAQNMEQPEALELAIDTFKKVVEDFDKAVDGINAGLEELRKNSKKEAENEKNRNR